MIIFNHFLKREYINQNLTQLNLFAITLNFLVENINNYQLLSVRLI